MIPTLQVGKGGTNRVSGGERMQFPVGAPSPDTHPQAKGSGPLVSTCVFRSLSRKPTGLSEFLIPSGTPAMLRVSSGGLQHGDRFLCKSDSEPRSCLVATCAIHKVCISTGLGFQSILA